MKLSSKIILLGIPAAAAAAAVIGIVAYRYWHLQNYKIANTHYEAAIESLSVDISISTESSCDENDSKGLNSAIFYLPNYTLRLELDSINEIHDAVYDCDAKPPLMELKQECVHSVYAPSSPIESVDDYYTNSLDSESLGLPASYQSIVCTALREEVEENPASWIRNMRHAEDRKYNIFTDLHTLKLEAARQSLFARLVGGNMAISIVDINSYETGVLYAKVDNDYTIIRFYLYDMIDYTHSSLSIRFHRCSEVSLESLRLIFDIPHGSNKCAELVVTG